MHRQLKELLHSATGASEFVVVVFLDVRGFSSFAKLAESSETAVFLKSVYTAILDEYFQDADFFKPTGDGLLVVKRYDEGSLTTVVREAIDKSIRLVEEFAAICAADPMINFEVPADLGIGLSRGAATRLASGELTLDYSGRPLNLASRLMDVARPSGVVFSEALGLSLLEEATAARFDSDEVYIKGLAEETPMRVHYLSDRTVIADALKRPLRKTQIYAESTESFTVRQLGNMGLFRFGLTKEPIDRSKVRLMVSHPEPTSSGTKRKGIAVQKELPTTYDEDSQGRHVRANLGALGRTLVAAGLKSTWKCNLTVEYRVDAE